MQDVLHFKLIKYTRKLLRKVDNRIKIRIGYKLLYSYINFILKADFKEAEKKLESSNCLKNNKDRIPYKFWIMWWQGIDEKNTPLIVKNNIYHLIKLVGKENVVVISKNNYFKYADIPEKLKNSLASGEIDYTSWSDIVRFFLLRDNGGYWIDSTVLFSNIFIKFIKKNAKSDFFTLCDVKKDYHNISYSRWMLWLMGGKPHYSFFEYMCNFYEVYFNSHRISIDYFLTDAAIANYYCHCNEFRKTCNSYKKRWYRYYWVENLESTYNSKYIRKFESDIEYSVQKITYKFDLRYLDKSDTLISNIQRKIERL